MRKILLFVSLFFALNAMAQQYVLPQPSVERYRLQISAKRFDLSAICVLKMDEEKTVRGSVVNEFGVHAFDFIVQPDRQRVKLLNVTGFLRKWYIKRTIRKDLLRMFQAQDCAINQPKWSLQCTENAVEYQNLKYAIHYVWSPLNDN